ncbi:MAG: hypothetical protein JW939_04755, partial [Candidatus Thermoplasmatota archaeon]|nr:hypothetical protein [Candidatus Thermoplasmatota archaeon]
MTVDEQGTVIFQPNGWQIGDLEWTMVLDDGSDQRSYRFSLNVENVNDPPIFSTPAPADSEVLVGEQFSYQFNAYDLDPMDGVQYSLPEGPTGSSIAFELGLLTWTPIIYLEEPQMFRVRATDREGDFSELVFYVNVTLTDNPPSITSEPPTELSDYIEWYYNLWVTELDDDIFFVELNEGPQGMYYDDIAESFIWTPNGSQIGSHEVSIKVSSTRFVIYQNFTVYVSRSPRVWEMKMDTSKDGMKVKGELLIGGTVAVSPSQVRGLYIKVGETEDFLPIEGESWTYEIDTREYDDGELVIRVRAFDGYENSTETSITVYIANDEGRTSPLLIVLVMIALFLIIAAGVLAIILMMRRKKAKDEENEKQKKLEDLQRSKQDMEQFIRSSDKVQGDTELYDQVEETQVDEKRLEAIDDIFSPMTGEQRSDLGSFTEEIPDDILQRAAVQESVIQQEPPSPVNNDIDNT